MNGRQVWLLSFALMSCASATGRGPQSSAPPPPSPPEPAAMSAPTPVAANADRSPSTAVVLTPNEVVIGAEVVDQLTLDEQRALQKAWAADNARLAAVLKSRLPPNEEVSLAVQPDVQYLSLVRVLSALKSLGFDWVSMDLGRGPSRIGIGNGLDLRPPEDGLLILFVRDGVSIKAPGGNVASGCQSAGPGLAVPRVSENYDYRALRDCIARVIAAARTPSLRNVFALANPDIPFQDFIDAARALDEAGAHLVGLRLPQ